MHPNGVRSNVGETKAADPSRRLTLFQSKRIDWMWTPNITTTTRDGDDRGRVLVIGKGKREKERKELNVKKE